MRRTINDGEESDFKARDLQFSLCEQESAIQVCECKTEWYTSISRASSSILLPAPVGGPASVSDMSMKARSAVALRLRTGTGESS